MVVVSKAFYIKFKCKSQYHHHSLRFYIPDRFHGMVSTPWKKFRKFFAI